MAEAHSMTSPKIGRFEIQFTVIGRPNSFEISVSTVAEIRRSIVHFEPEQKLYRNIRGIVERRTQLLKEDNVILCTASQLSVDTSSA
jgi:hypothetical protein